MNLGKYSLLAYLASIFICSAFASAGTGPWVLTADQRNGLPLLMVAGNTALVADFVFWGKNWAWAPLSTEFKVVAPFEYAIAGKNKPLNFDLTARTRRSSARKVAWEFALNASTTTPDIIGGGISFRLNLRGFASQLGEPELLPDNRGWSWGRPGENRLEVRFDPPMASVYFERGQKNEIRTFFYKNEIAQGLRRHVATVEVSGDIAIGPSDPERFGLEDTAAWPTDILDWRTSPVDLSFLNAPERPAGKRGFVKAQDDGLVFDDGTPVHFWGTNLTAFALFSNVRKEDVTLAARRLSQLGFNLVRLHHHDSPWVNPNVFGEKATDTRTVSDSILESLDWWIKCFKDEGIYVFLDLHVQRHLTPSDGIDDFDEISKGKTSVDLKGFNYINTSIQTAMKRFNYAYVTHVNRFTGLAYKDEPAIIAMLLTNENDVTHHFGNALLPDKKVPKHNALYMAQAEVFASQHGLPKDRTWRAWEHGPSKIFLNDLENRFNAAMIGQLRTIGVKAAIVTTSTWGTNPLSSLPALTAGDLIAVHSYGGIGEIERSPLYGANMIHWMAAAQVTGKPLIIPEWNVSPFPVPDRHTIPIYVAAAASHQGWAGAMQYAYSQQVMNNAGSPSNWQAFNDPSLIATLPAAALLYRRGDIRLASTTYAFAPTSERLLGEAISPANSLALRTASERGKLVIVLPRIPQLAWLDPAPPPPGAHIITDPSTSVLDQNAVGATSDTGELHRDWEQGIYSIDTPRTQAVMGWIGGKEIKLADVEIAARTHNATVAVQSLDDRPISLARTILISLGARSLPKAGNQVPFHSEPVTGRLVIRAAPGLKLYRQHGAPRDAREIPTRYAGGRYHIDLDTTLASYWLVLK